jgi:hypothetical protein
MRLIFENWRSYLNNNSNLLREEFYFLSDEEHEKPLSPELLKVLANKLPGSVSAKESGELKASGAEGVVLSLDDYRVIKIFHSLDNAAKNLPLVSKNVPETAQVYSTGKIVLDQPVIYFRKGSSYTPTEASATEEIYYIVMQRVKPDSFIYRYVELAYDSFNRLSNIDLNKLLQLYEIEDPALKERINEIFVSFMQDPINEEYPVKFGSIDEFLQNATKKQKNILINQFNKYRKSRTKEFVFTSQNRPVNLKKMILNYLQIENDIPYSAEAIVDFLINDRAFQRTPKKSFTNNTIAQDFMQIIDLVKKIRIDKKMPWNDIHQEQFGRDKENNLIALDLGIKGDQDLEDAAHAFNKNVSRLATKGQEIKVISEVDDSPEGEIKVLNVYDFDRTLFFTHDNIEGKKKYEQVFGEKYPHKGWFGREESLSDELDIKKNKNMWAIYDVLKSEPNSLSILMSNRVYKLQDRIKEFLTDRGYVFDSIILKKGGVGKAARLQAFWEDHQSVNKINVFDDLDKALEEYKELRDKYSIWREDLQFNIFKVTPTKIVKV